MIKVNLTDIVAAETASPKGRYRLFRLDISRAIAAKRNGSPAPAGHCPFEVEMVRLPPRATNWPYHAHTAQWEFYAIVSGRGQVRTPEGLIEVRDGDCLLHPPGEAHQMINTGAKDLVYYVIADNPPGDVVHCPDSGKYLLPHQPKPVRVQPVSLYDGEE